MQVTSRVLLNKAQNYTRKQHENKLMWSFPVSQSTSVQSAVQTSGQMYTRDYP